MSEQSNKPTPAPKQDVKPQKSDLDFVADTKAAFLENRSPYASILLFVIVGIISAFTFWASKSSIDEVTRGQGKVVPSSYLQVVQSLEGGILSELKVAEGDIVEKGQSLLKIDSTAFTAAMSESSAQRDNLMASIARLEAEAAAQETIEFPQHIAEHRQDLVQSESKLFQSRRENLKSSVEHLTKSLEFKRKELDMTRPLAAKGIVSQVELLRLESVVNDTESELARIQSEYTKEVLTSRNDAKGKLEQVLQNIIAFEDKIRRTNIQSPVTGTINKVNFKTLGGVIRSGEPIIEIVPNESDLIVEANVAPKDIGFIHPGQEATVKLTAYDFSIYGGLKGVVEHISADTLTDERGDSFYTIRVRTSERTLSTSEQSLKIIPGMQVEVDILTGEKTILDYIFKPLLRAKMNALTER
ncbi:HlyD family type I secretion periplasmic adaptor subunit [Pelagicoccus mobilis]|uniref:HlyD family type I secretion periplasmic adaptor subunit n=1 Tax=Pelagicoccus mobilis TaxID=415221 RepID=A0A934S357_9BACT|nr:HlyD family type I secretion periplasmic adaptor subunit [Pelagicoccus mobilis]MBK1878559.1 HlyD family type I secretion periplasmic adaptor subunit [Pelagicoccus mobilis]